MDGERPGLAEPPAAAPALVGLLLGVGVHVVPQVILPLEGLVAQGAGEGPLTGVDTLVDLKVVSLGELSAAELADVSLLLLLFHFPNSVVVPHDIVEEAEAVDHVDIV